MITFLIILGIILIIFGITFIILKTRPTKIEKVVCDRLMLCSLLLPPTIISKNKSIVVRVDLSYHTLDKKGLRNIIGIGKDKEVLFEEYTIQTSEDWPCLIVSKLVRFKADVKYTIGKGIKFIFRYNNNYYLGTVIRETEVSYWYDNPEKHVIPVCVGSDEINVHMSDIVAKVNQKFADWHYE